MNRLPALAFSAILPFASLGPASAQTFSAPAAASAVVPGGAGAAGLSRLGGPRAGGPGLPMRELDIASPSPTVLPSVAAPRPNVEPAPPSAPPSAPAAAAVFQALSPVVPPAAAAVFQALSPVVPPAAVQPSPTPAAAALSVAAAPSKLPPPPGGSPASSEEPAPRPIRKLSETFDGRKKPNILFVCTGNTCRSPMAEIMLRDMAERDGLDGEIEVFSRGLFAAEGSDLSPPARQALIEQGIVAGRHTAAQLGPSDVERADLILAMSEGHLRALDRDFPEAMDKTYLLKDYAGTGGGSISDPDTASMEAVFRWLSELPLPRFVQRLMRKVVWSRPVTKKIYRETAAEIREALRSVWQDLKQVL